MHRSHVRVSAHLGVLPLEADEVNLCLVSTKIAGDMEVDAMNAVELGCTA